MFGVHLVFGCGFSEGQRDRGTKGPKAVKLLFAHGSRPWEDELR
jgi:hypothetical protein